MTFTINIFDRFGPVCVNGNVAAEFRDFVVSQLDSNFSEIVLDFSGVRNMNSSFANALLVPLFATKLAAKLRFKNCRANVRVMIEFANSLAEQNSRLSVSTP